MIAILIANGFNEKELVAIQKGLRPQNMVAKMVSSENGVVNGWADQSWGCFFPVDVSLSEALASDFAGLIVMGGDKSIQRLAKTAHTQRFIQSFIRSEKPILSLDDASEIVESDAESVTHIETSTEILSDVLIPFLESVQNGHIEMDMAA